MERSRPDNGVFSHFTPGQFFRFAAVLLFVKTFASVLYEYRWYFPPNFEESAFLSGRERMFVGGYRLAFYAHLVFGPAALLTAVFLMLRSTRFGARFTRWHALVGRLQFGLVTGLSISGAVMARHAMTGATATVGFLVLAVLTLATCAIAAWHAIKKDFAAHRIWATRCFLLLCSPLLLRIVGGIAMTTGLESEALYRWTVWLSWLGPLLFYELIRRDVPGYAPIRRIPRNDATGETHVAPN